MIKTKLNSLSGQYLAALRKYLKQGPLASLQPALRLGRQAVKSGLDTLELARIHERALTTLELPAMRKGMIKRAGIFFAGANTRIEETHRAARRSKVGAGKNGKHPKTCLEDSLQVQKRLRQLTHRVLADCEDERAKISHELHDEIAQTLLGINVRLLALKKEGRSDIKGLKNEIASTQRLVVKSVRSVRRVARELNIHQQGPRRRAITKSR